MNCLQLALSAYTIINNYNVVRVCVCVCMRAHTHVYVYVLYVCCTMHVCTYACMHVCIIICMYACIRPVATG